MVGNYKTLQRTLYTPEQRFLLSLQKQDLLHSGSDQPNQGHMTDEFGLNALFDDKANPKLHAITKESLQQRIDSLTR